MSVEPNTIIKVYHGIPLDVTQTRSIAFANISAQNDYFHSVPNSKLKYSFLRSTYQRVRRGRLRIEQSADNLYDCNYMAFQNTNYGQKWFYAFITSVEYINDITSEITFVIDELQTWLFDMTLQPCIVERTHPTTDVIGEHIEPEPVMLGEYVMNYKKVSGEVVESYEPLAALSELAVIVAIIDAEGEIVGGKLYDGIFGGANLYAFERSDVASIKTLIETYIITPECVVSIYMLPKTVLQSIFTQGMIPVGGVELPNNIIANPIRVIKTALNGNEALDGYVPKNKKLYTYPYNYYHVDNSSGTSLKLRYELFEDLRPTMEICATITQPVELMLRPYAYKNCTPSAVLKVFQDTLNTETLTLNTFPICSWTTDGFQAWLVNTGIPYGLNVVGNIVDTGMAMAISNYSNGGASGMGMGIPQINTPTQPMNQQPPTTGDKDPYATTPIKGGDNFGLSATGLLNAYYSASIQGDITKGNFSNAGANCATGRHQFYGGRCSITAEFAKIIDDFFTIYGYTIKRIMTPNLRARPHWTYVKTMNCNIVGNLPSNSIEAIKAIFNTGITWWRNPSEVGNYALPNQPV